MPDKIYDLEALNALVDGNEKFRKYLVALFIETTPPILADIRKSLEDKDYVNVHAHTHKMKPTLDSMGMVKLRPLVQQLMEESKQGKNSDLIQNLVEVICDKVELAIEQLKSSEL